MKTRKINPLVSVIITTKNSKRTIMRLLKSIKVQSYKNIEIILVDNHSSDGTVEIAGQFTKKIYLGGPERSAQRNFGAKKAKGEYLLVLDSDMVLTKNVIEECVEKSQNLTGGMVIPEQSFGRGFWAKVKSFEREINKGEPYFESARFFPKKVFWEFGGYDESLTGPEDWDLPQRIARHYRVERIESLILHNEGRLTLTTLFKKKFYYGISVDKYLKSQNLPILGPATVYLLRPAFYKNWKEILSHPFLSMECLSCLLWKVLAGV